MKLEKFDQNKKKKRYITCGIVFVVLAVIGIVFYRSYALYQEEKTFDVIKGNGTDFAQLAFTINGEKNDGAFPEKESGYVGSSVTCTDGVSAEWSNREWGVTKVTAKENTKINCNIDFVTGHNLTNEVQIGQYVSMTPTSTSYKISKGLTGYSSDQTINPSELNLWRVIKKNEDGTIEMVSDSISSKYVYFNGQTGFLKLVGTYIKLQNNMKIINIQ